MSDHEPTDLVERRLGATLHRLADEAPTALPGEGHHIVERRVHQRAARRRRTMGVGMAAAVVALVGGVMALRPEPATKLSFGDEPGAATPVAGVVTGYSTGSMTGSPRGWSNRYDLGPDEVDLPRLVADLDPAWQPTTVAALTSEQGTGTAAGPLTILADGGRFVVASVQPIAQLGPGVGEQVDIGGKRGTVFRERDGTIQLTADVDGAQRAMVTARGIDRVELFALVASLHQQDGAWVMAPVAGSGLQPVASTPATSYRQRSIQWGRPLDPQATTTTAAPGSPPTTDPALLDVLGETVSVSLSTGGAWEYYGLLSQRAGWSRVVAASEGRTQIGGVTLVASASFEDGGGGSATIGYDAQGVVYQVERWLNSGSAGAEPVLQPMTVRLVLADDARWTSLVTVALRNRAAQAARLDEEIARKEDLEASGMAGATIAPAPTTTPPTTTATSTP